MAGLAVALTAVPLVRSGVLAGQMRSSSFHHTHGKPVPRFGGLAFAIAFVAVGVCALIVAPSVNGTFRIPVVFFVTALAMFGLGFWDDLRALGAKRKLLLQVAIASAAYIGGVRIDHFQVPLMDREIALGTLSGPVTVLWLVAFTNLMNLIDGIDGLAAGVGFMLMSLLVVVGVHSGLPFVVLCATGLAGAQLGFLRYNFPPARIYMGDGGAYFIGFVIGMITIVNSQKGTVIAALLAPLFALALPIVDVATAILRRGSRGLPIFRADTKHIHHKLLARGFSRRKTVAVLYVICIICLLFAFAVFAVKGVWLPLLFGIFCVTLLSTARSIDFGRDWLAFGRVIGNSLDLRKDSRYALPLVRWLELEAERAGSIDELWSGFEFICLKFRFTRATLSGAINRSWRISPDITTGREMDRSYEMPLHPPGRIDFSANTAQTSEASFELLSELAAEAWFRAWQRWQEIHSEWRPNRSAIPIDTSGADGEPQAL